MWGVILADNPGYGAFGPFKDKELAERFASYLTTEVNAARLVVASDLPANTRWCSPTGELLDGWAYRHDSQKADRAAADASAVVLDKALESLLELRELVSRRSAERPELTAALQRLARHDGRLDEVTGDAIARAATALTRLEQMEQRHKADRLTLERISTCHSNLVAQRSHTHGKVPRDVLDLAIERLAHAWHGTPPADPLAPLTLDH